MAAATLLAPIFDAKQRRSLERQQEQFRVKGFPGPKPELGHAVAYALRRQGRSLLTCLVAGHYAAAGGQFNFQGNRRIAKWAGVSLRTVQRIRRLLEDDQLIKSYLLMPGDMVEGQRAPVRRPQVVRDVSALQRLVSVRLSQGYTKRRRARRPGPSAAETPKPVASMPSSAEFFDELARKHPDLASPLGVIAAAKRAATEQRRPPKPPRDAAPAPTAAELDEIDRELAALERQLAARVPPDKPAPG